MPKGSQNDAKMEPKIIDFSWFFEKGENARNHCIYKLKRGSGHVKSYEKWMQNQCKINAGKRYAKMMKIVLKLSQNLPKRVIKSMPNRLKFDKK